MTKTYYIEEHYGEGDQHRCLTEHAKKVDLTGITRIVCDVELQLNGNSTYLINGSNSKDEHLNWFNPALEPYVGEDSDYIIIIKMIVTRDE